MGHVYFFRHKNLKGVKIGCTESDDVTERFNSFKTYSPNGAEILGTIETNEPHRLEKELHSRYSQLRLNGEFFNIDKDEIDSLINIKSPDNEFINKYLSLSISDKNILLKILNKFLSDRNKTDESETVEYSAEIENDLIGFMLNHNGDVFYASVKDLMENIFKNKNHITPYHLRKYFWKKLGIKPERFQRYYPLNLTNKSKPGQPYKIDKILFNGTRV